LRVLMLNDWVKDNAAFGVASPGNFEICYKNRYYSAIPWERKKGGPASMQCNALRLLVGIARTTVKGCFCSKAGPISQGFTGYRVFPILTVSLREESVQQINIFSNKNTQ